jgi:hypothetical protein
MEAGLKSAAGSDLWVKTGLLLRPSPLAESASTG